MTDPDTLRGQVAQWLEKWEMAVYGTRGNTFEIGHLRRLNTFFSELATEHEQLRATVTAQAARLRELEADKEELGCACELYETQLTEAEARIRDLEQALKLIADTARAALLTPTPAAK